jgi:hypothetical protein
MKKTGTNTVSLRKSIDEEVVWIGNNPRIFTKIMGYRICSVCNRYESTLTGRIDGPSVESIAEPRTSGFRIEADAARKR